MNPIRRALAGLGIGCVSLLAYYSYHKRKAAEELKMKTSSIGTPLLGGHWTLVDTHGNAVTDIDFQGKPVLMYFGYTFCPDVCPEELAKIGTVVDLLKKAEINVTPLFVSCDPKRDSLKAIDEYLADFHPSFVGLTGTHGQIKMTAKKFRIYYSAPPKALDDDETDYLVDHSIFTYLLGADGKFLNYFARSDTAETMVQQIRAAVGE